MRKFFDYEVMYYNFMAFIYTACFTIIFRSAAADDGGNLLSYFMEFIKKYMVLMKLSFHNLSPKHEAVFMAFYMIQRVSFYFMIGKHHAGRFIQSSNKSSA